MSQLVACCISIILVWKAGIFVECMLSQDVEQLRVAVNVYDISKSGELHATVLDIDRKKIDYKKIPIDKIDLRSETSSTSFEIAKGKTLKITVFSGQHSAYVDCLAANVESQELHINLIPVIRDGPVGLGVKLNRNLVKEQIATFDSYIKSVDLLPRKTQTEKLIFLQAMISKTKQEFLSSGFSQSERSVVRSEFDRLSDRLLGAGELLERSPDKRIVLDSMNYDSMPTVIFGSGANDWIEDGSLGMSGPNASAFNFMFGTRENPTLVSIEFEKLASSWVYQSVDSISGFGSEPLAWEASLSDLFLPFNNTASNLEVAELFTIQSLGTANYGFDLNSFFEDPDSINLSGSQPIKIEIFGEGAIEVFANSPDLTGSISYSIVDGNVDMSWLSDLEIESIDFYGARSISGDLNGDGIVDLLDVAPFVEALTSGGYHYEADVNEDDSTDLLDVAPFVDLLMGR